MATESDLKQEIADERLELTNAVASLKTELEHTADTGKKVAAVIGAAVAARAVYRLLRRDRD
jgi:hypothetical protein